MHDCIRWFKCKLKPPKNRVQMKALLEARDQCYAADKLCAQEVHGAILGLNQIPLWFKSINGTSSNWGFQGIA